MSWGSSPAWEYEQPPREPAAIWNDVHVNPEDYGPGPPIQTTKVRHVRNGRADVNVAFRF